MAATAGGWSHEATFEAIPISASLARRFVAGRLAEHRLLHLVDAVRLVVSELATNALLHAQTPFAVTLSAADGALLLSVRDGSLRLPARGPTRALDTSGRGLDIVGLLSLEWGITGDADGSKSVWASFALRDEHEVQPRSATDGVTRPG